MHRLTPRILLVLAMVSLLVGCATPAHRAKVHAAAFGRLSLKDQKLVLRGKVRPGLTEEAVVIAWGEPDARQPESGGSGKDGKGSRQRSTWTYRRELTVHTAIGSYSQWPPGNSLTVPGASAHVAPGYGFGGVSHGGFLRTHPRTQPTDSWFRRALFVDGRLQDYRSWYGELPLPP